MEEEWINIFVKYFRMFFNNEQKKKFVKPYLIS